MTRETWRRSHRPKAARWDARAKARELSARAIAVASYEARELEPYWPDELSTRAIGSVRPAR